MPDDTLFTPFKTGDKVKEIFTGKVYTVKYAYSQLVVMECEKQAFKYCLRYLK